MKAHDEKISQWRKSSYSGPTSNCVEVGFGENAVGVRDTKDRGSAILEFSASRWKDFVRGLQ